MLTQSHFKRRKNILGVPEESRNDPGLNLFGSGFFATSLFLKNQKKVVMRESS